MELADLTTNSDAIQDEIKILQEKIMEIGGVRLRSQAEKVDSLKEQINTQQSNLAKLTAEKGAREKNLTKLGEKIAKKEAELAGIDDQIEAAQAELAKKAQECQSFKKMASEANSVIFF